MDNLTEEVQSAAQKAVAMCESRIGGGLDFSEASLTIVEDMLGEAAQFASDMTTEQLDILGQDFGCYILEVARREFGGCYYWFEQRDQPVLVVGEPTFRISIIAWDKVRSRLGGDPADNIPFFYSGFAERARRRKPGDEALYV